MRKEIKRILEEEVMTIPEVASMLGLQGGTISDRIYDNKIDFVKKGRMNLLDKADFIHEIGKYKNKTKRGRKSSII